MHSPPIPHQILLLLAPLLCTVPAAWAQTAPAPAICDRTPQVRAWITGQVPGVTHCAELTTEQLAAISADIDLSGDGITTLQAGDFQGLELIDTLDLSSNGLTMLPAGVFDGLRLSGSLDLSSNDLTMLPAGVFDGLRLSGSLDLSSNDLTMLPAEVFDGLRLSGSLDLSSNNLRTLPAGLLDGLSVGDTLDLSSNDLRTLPAEVFEGLRLSGSLDLSSNDLRTLPAGAFEGLSVGDTLDLSSNDLTMLPAGVFEGLRLSGSLDLSSNDLTMLPAEAFDGLRLSGSLGLFSNDLTTLPAGVFDGLSVGDTLYLSSNDLTMLPAGVFDGLRLSGSLDLSSNDLTTLSAGVFEGLSIMEPSGGLKLNNNPGSPFPLTVELERIGAVPSVASPAEVRLRLIEGTPFAITAPLTISVADTESSGEATLAAGATTSSSLTIMGSGTTTISLGELPALPDNYQGLRLRGSAPLVLFGTVDDTAPTIIHAELSSPEPRAQTYATDEMIEATLTFSEAVIIDTTTGRPGFALQIGTAVREAVYSSGGRSTTTLVFRYLVVDGDEDSDGIGWAAEALHLNGGTLADRAGNAASLVVPEQAAVANHKVFAAQVMMARADTSAAEGDLVRIEVNMSLPFGMDLQLYYSAPSSGVAPFYNYRTRRGPITIAAGETTVYIESMIINDDLAERAEKFVVTLQGAFGEDDLFVRRREAYHTNTVTILPDPDDAIMASLTGPAFVREGASGEYIVNLAGGTPTTDVVVPYTITGTATTGADYTAPGSPLRILAGQSRGTIAVPTANDGPGDADETLVMTLGTPTGGGGPAASLTVGTRQLSTTITESARVVGATLLSVPRSITRNAYGAGEQIIVRMRFSEAVQLRFETIGAPVLVLGIGAENVALAISGMEGTELMFEHTVSATDVDADGLSIAADALDLVGTTLMDTGGAKVGVSLGSHAFNNDSAHKVDGSQTVAAMNLSGDDRVDIVDAKLLHYALRMQAALGDGSEGSGDAGVRAEVLGSLVQASDAQWRGMLRAVHALTPMPSPADLNGDHRVDSNDATLFYYTQVLPAALMDAQLRMTILGPLYPGADDDTLQQLLEAISRFGETP